jgi:hypothetical protein
MKIKFSSQTKSFIILFLIAFLGAYICLIVARNSNFPAGLAAIEIVQQQYYQKLGNAPAATTSPFSYSAANYPSYLPVDSTTTVDISGWKTYTDTTYNFSVKYPPAWKVLKPDTEKGYYVVNFDPGAKFYNVKIYVGPQGYFALENMPYITITIAGEKTIDIEGVLYGLMHGNNYYTFDQGYSQSIKPEFEALVKSLEFR